MTRKILLLIFFIGITSFAQSQTKLNDGYIFDQGLKMKQASESADPELKKLANLIGTWDLKIKKRTSDSTFHTSNGMALFYYLNRGHGIAEKVHAANYDGNNNEINLINFYAFNPASQKWLMGSANGYSESVTVYDGDIKNKNLSVQNAKRFQGGINLMQERVSVDFSEEGKIKTIIQSANFNSNEWEIIEEREYTKNDEMDESRFYSQGIGSPANSRLPESAEFDFLLGEWNSKHELNLPNGQKAKWISNSTGVYVLNGNGVMEHDWFDTDPNLPDAATTIVRIYNRAQRRWECMYITNRFNGILHFGGRKEGDEIVLTLFEVDNSSPSFSYFTFYDIEKDKFKWHSTNFTNHGNQKRTGWSIEQERKTN